MRPVERSVSIPRALPPRPRERGKRWAWFAALTTLAVMLILHFGTSHAAATHNAIRSGYPGTCLDVRHNVVADGAPVDAVTCNGSAAQNWTTTVTTVRLMGTKSCVARQGEAIVLSACTDTPGQVWLRDKQGYFNPDSGKCLYAPKVGDQLQLANCGVLSGTGGQWSPNEAAQAPRCGGGEGEAIACNAVRQWMAWQADRSNHESLLTAYTDGTPYEAWCADFISYVYKQSGHPFTDGSADGWDENNANDVQYMGFTMHAVGSGYQPKAGDVAFFDYPGGHVEIVVSGGKKPTFVYGDSAEIDPTTGNGQMKANTITRGDDGTSGQLTYYLSPK